MACFHVHALPARHICKAEDAQDGRQHHPQCKGGLLWPCLRLAAPAYAQTPRSRMQHHSAAAQPVLLITQATRCSECNSHVVLAVSHSCSQLVRVRNAKAGCSRLPTQRSQRVPCDYRLGVHAGAYRLGCQASIMCMQHNGHRIISLLMTALGWNHRRPHAWMKCWPGMLSTATCGMQL